MGPSEKWTELASGEVSDDWIKSKSLKQLKLIWDHIWICQVWDLWCLTGVEAGGFSTYQKNASLIYRSTWSLTPPGLVQHSAQGYFDTVYQNIVIVEMSEMYCRKANNCIAYFKAWHKHLKDLVTQAPDYIIIILKRIQM